MNRVCGTVSGLFVGALIGAALGILFAPRAGEETREMLKDKANAACERVRSKIDEWRSQAGEDTSAA